MSCTKESPKVIETDKAPKGVGVYSQALQVENTYYFSGQIGIDPSTMELKEGFLAQLNQIFANIDGVLNAADLQRSHIIKTTVFLQDMQYFNDLNNEYKKYFQHPYPTRSCVQVAKLPKNALVEIEVIGYCHRH